MNKSTPVINIIQHKSLILFSLIILSANSFATGLCGLTLSVSGSSSTCVGHDTLSLTGASTGSHIQWLSATTTNTVDSSNGTIDTTFVPTVAGSYIAIVTDPGGCQDTSQAIVVDSAVTPSVSISINTSDTICPNTSVTFTPTPTNAGTPSYQWYLNGNPISSANFYTNSTLSNNDSVWVVMTGNAPCSTTSSATSNVIHIAVTTPVTPSVTAATGHSHTICAGTKITFTPTPIHGGSAPTYQWYLNGTMVSTATIFIDSTLADQDSVWVVLTSNAACLSAATAASSPIHYVVNPMVTPTVSISSNVGDTICRNDQSILYATSTNGGTNPSYQWVANGRNVGNSATYIGTTLVDGDTYYCVLTSNASCVTQTHATSDTIRFTVHPYPAVTIGLTGGSAACSADSVGLSASGGVSYLWSDGETSSSIFVPAGTYSVTATNSYGCTAGSNTLVAAPHQLLTDSLVQTGDTLSLTDAGGQFYQWYLNGSIISGAIGSEYVAVHTGDYQVSVIDSFGCRSSSAVVSIIQAGINTSTGENVISLFPNPSSGMITIDCGDNIPRQITISDEIGRVVMKDISIINSQSLDLSSLRDGIYYIQLSDGKTVRTLKCSIVRL